MALRAVSAGRQLAPLAVLVPILGTPIVAVYVLALATPRAALVIAVGLIALAFLVVGNWGLRTYRLGRGLPLAVAASFALLLLLEGAVPWTHDSCET